MRRELVSVALPTPLRRTFDYLVPNSPAHPLAPGVRVRVSLGKRESIGIVTHAPRMETLDDARRYKPIDEVLDESPLLARDTLALCEFASEYYQHSLGEVFATAIP